MDKEALGALKKCIKYWNRIMNVQTSMRGIRGCALCKLYRSSQFSADCYDCPIFKNTGFPGCMFTPFEDFYMSDDKHRTLTDNVMVGGPNSLAAAMAGLYYLLTLLPDDAKCPI